ncbi:MAG: sigma-70 family RNA polymerase sigma factor [Candidatus Margulisbacteria bacterium]|nr:sigma-70 family RNA polymerase sigma factor [Candidatus Margulisiibacteriota bacterium]MBU1021487.1 sigma-70 family RNA polymerase sigma factor [Candidatus Margulisiibacteriota bacterium]MBU1728572.1 sigma-70 family RNA polymerase sigma factor [Candidatus Margulisiibacteriota bacterium]MBU1955849.1 sigma-70 family RNA polymerase sigma factor [Candidatus Margulisiibacteriota bacterium]
MANVAKKDNKAAPTKKMPKSLEAYMPLVHSIASMVSGKGLPPSIDYNDLVSDGTVGLMKAWERFDSKRGVKFETYASYRIRGEILDGLKNYNPVPYRVQVMIRDMAKKGYSPEETKIIEEKEKKLLSKKLTETEFKSALSRIKKIVKASALMYLLSLEGLSETHEVQVASERTPETESEFLDLRNKLFQAVAILPELEQKVVIMFYREGLNQKTIASKLRLSRSKVNRLLAKAIDRLKDKVK